MNSISSNQADMIMVPHSFADLLLVEKLRMLKQVVTHLNLSLSPKELYHQLQSLPVDNTPLELLLLEQKDQSLIASDTIVCQEPPVFQYSSISFVEEHDNSLMEIADPHFATETIDESVPVSSVVVDEPASSSASVVVQDTFVSEEKIPTINQIVSQDVELKFENITSFDFSKEPTPLTHSDNPFSGEPKKELKQSDDPIGKPKKEKKVKHADDSSGEHKKEKKPKHSDDLLSEPKKEKKTKQSDDPSSEPKKEKKTKQSDDPSSEPKKEKKAKSLDSASGEVSNELKKEKKSKKDQPTQNVVDTTDNKSYTLYDIVGSNTSEGVVPPVVHLAEDKKTKKEKKPKSEEDKKEKKHKLEQATSEDIETSPPMAKKIKLNTDLSAASLTTMASSEEKVKKPRKEVPDDQRCIALIKSGEQCTSKHSDDTSFCKKHAEKQEHGTVGNPVEKAPKKGKKNDHSVTDPAHVFEPIIEIPSQSSPFMQKSNSLDEDVYTPSENETDSFPVVIMEDGIKYYVDKNMVFEYTESDIVNCVGSYDAVNKKILFK